MGLNELAIAIIADPTISDWQKYPAQAWLDGLIPDDQFINGTAWYANRDFFTEISFGSSTDIIQDAVQLLALGQSTTDRAQENIRQDQAIQELIRIREEQRAEDQATVNSLIEHFNQLNERVSGQLEELGQNQIDLGNSQVDLSNALNQQGTSNFLTGLGIGGGTATLLIVGILIFIMVKRK